MEGVMPYRKSIRLPVHRLLSAAALAAMLTCATNGQTRHFNEPAVFASKNGVLNITMIATPQPIPTISFMPPDGSPAINPTGWVWQICQRPPSGDQCPAGHGTASDYGGVRLALQQGDTLNIHFVNNLPPVDPNKLNHATEPGNENLFLNPTNLHT